MRKTFMADIFIFVSLLALNFGANAQDQDQETVKWSPSIVVTSQTNNGYEINTKYLMPFLENILLTEEIGNFDDLPYVFAHGDSSIISSAQDNIYVSGITNKDVTSYSILEKGDVYTDLDTGEHLGAGLIVKGNAQLISNADNVNNGNNSDLMVMQISDIKLPIVSGDRLIPVKKLVMGEILRSTLPEKKIQAKVIATTFGLKYMGVSRSLVLSAGAREGVGIGNVFDVIKSDREVSDSYNNKNNKNNKNKKNKNNKKNNKKVLLEGIKFAEIIVYRVFEKVSLGVVITATEAIAVGDRLQIKDQEMAE